MSRSLIQVTNQYNQTLEDNSVISLDSVLRRYGCNLRLVGNAIEVVGEGYYKVDACVTATPTAEGTVTVALYKDGVPVPGAVGSQTGTGPMTIPLIDTIRLMCCDGASNLTLVLEEGAGVVSNVSLRVEKS
jgi:hypothetical protein